MSEAVVVILDVFQDLAAAGFKYMRCQFFCSRFPGASGYRNDRPVPRLINAVGEVLQCLYRIINKHEPIGIWLELRTVLLKSVMPHNAGSGAFFERLHDIFRRVLEVAIEPVVRVIRLREREKNVARPDLARVDNDRRDLTIIQGGVQLCYNGVHQFNCGLQSQVFLLFVSLVSPLVASIDPGRTIRDGCAETGLTLTGATGLFFNTGSLRLGVGVDTDGAAAGVAGSLMRETDGPPPLGVSGISSASTTCSAKPSGLTFNSGSICWAISRNTGPAT